MNKTKNKLRATQEKYPYQGMNHNEFKWVKSLCPANYSTQISEGKNMWWRQMA